MWSLGSIKGFSNAWFTDEETESQVNSVSRVTVSEGRAQIMVMKTEWLKDWGHQERRKFEF